VAEGYGNGDQRLPMGHVAREGLYFTLLLLISKLLNAVSAAAPVEAALMQQRQ